MLDKESTWWNLEQRRLTRTLACIKSKRTYFILSTFSQHPNEFSTSIVVSIHLWMVNGNIATFERIGVFFKQNAKFKYIFL